MCISLSFRSISINLIHHSVVHSKRKDVFTRFEILCTLANTIKKLVFTHLTTFQQWEVARDFIREVPKDLLLFCKTMRGFCYYVTCNVRKLYFRISRSLHWWPSSARFIAAESYLNCRESLFRMNSCFFRLWWGLLMTPLLLLLGWCRCCCYHSRMIQKIRRTFRIHMFLHLSYVGAKLGSIVKNCCLVCKHEEFDM